MPLPQVMRFQLFYRGNIPLYNDNACIFQIKSIPDAYEELAGGLTIEALRVINIKFLLEMSMMRTCHKRLILQVDTSTNSPH